MHRLRLSTLLVIVNVGLLLLAVAGVALAASRLLEQYADEQMRTRVAQAGAIAHQEIARAGESAQVTAQLLSERPTLLRLLQAGDDAGLAQFLDQFQRTSRLDGIAVLRAGQLVASSGAALPWGQIAAAPEGRLLYGGEAGQPPLLAVRAPVAALPGAQVLAGAVLNQAVAARLSQLLGLSVQIDTAAGQAGSSSDGALYQWRQPLADAGGTVVGTLVTSLPTTARDQSLQQLTRSLLELALAVALLAGLTSFALGQRLGRPLRALTGAAARIGQGDLTTPIAVAPGGEIGRLASTLEEMRWRLLRLTADLRRQQSESQAIITGIVEGVFSVDRERRIRFVNPQAAALLGASPEALIGRFCGDVLNPQGPGGERPCAEHCPIIHARFRDGAQATEHLLLPDGRRRTVVVASAPPTDDQQVQVLRDETEREAVRRLRDAVLANISHEFRTPLSAQLASIELLLDQLPALTTEQIGQLILALQRGTLRLTQLIDNLLESARIESGSFAIRRGPVAIDEVVETALELTLPLLRQRGQQAQVQLPFPLPILTGDAQLLTQVFVNLLANANKFAPSGSTITIGGATGADALTVWVEDQGPGLPQAGGEALFGQFVRSLGAEPEQSGVGLGLWIVQSIVARHDGRIEAHNTSQGTRVVLTLPCAPAVAHGSH